MERTAFNWKDFLGKVAVIAIPVALQNLLTTTGSMIDTMMIASLGQTEVGAVGLCAQFSSLMFSCYWGFIGGGMLFFSQYWGAKDHKGIHRSYGLTLTCMMTVAFVFCILALFFPEAVMRLYTDKPSIQQIGVEYLRIVGFAYPLMVFSMAMAALLRCTERVRIPLYGSIAAVIVNVFLNWVFIFGHLGIPAMGVRGAALATVIAQSVSILVVIFLAKRNGHPYLLAVRKHFRWQKPLVREYFRKCAPIIMNEVFIGAGNMVINIVLGRQPEEAIAAIAVFRTLEGLIIGFFAGFANAASVLVGKEVGAGHIDTAYDHPFQLLRYSFGKQKNPRRFQLLGNLPGERQCHPLRPRSRWRSWPEDQTAYSFLLPYPNLFLPHFLMNRSSDSGVSALANRSTRICRSYFSRSVLIVSIMGET